jgi:hypothetical protein
MTNYFYTDTNGRKCGPIDDQQLKVWIAQRIITPQTPLETESGHKGLAGQIPGLVFPRSGPSFQTAQSAMNATASMVRQAAERKGIFSWLLDFSFRNIKLPVINLWFCRIVYAIYCIAAILGLIGGTLAMIFFTLQAISHSPFLFFLGILYVLLLWIVIAIAVIGVRLFLEWEIMTVDWICLTTKAARRFLDDDKT